MYPPAALLAFWPAFGRDDFWPKTFEFLALTGQGLGLGLLVSLPLGILLSRRPRLAGPVLALFGMVQTVPSLALLGFCVSVLALIGAPVAVIAAVVYTVFPVVLNTYTGITQVDPRLKDAARGMGLTGTQLLWRLELPLALPVILAGVRTGVVYAIGMITISAIVGAGGLGVFITAGLSRGDAALILLGVVPILALTVLVFLALTGVARLARTRADLGLLVGGTLIVLLAGYGAAAAGARLIEPTAAPLLAGADAPAAVSDPSLAEAWEQADGFWGQAFGFVSLALRGLGVALLLGVPAGVLLTRVPRLADPLISALALIQTVPSLALLGVLVSLSGLHFAGLTVPPLFGPRAAVLATVVYSLFPVVLNTYTGIAQVNPRLRDAARGMGMTGWQTLTRVELPLALPVVMDGVRTAAVFAVGMVTVAAMVGAGGLGDYVLQGMAMEDPSLILLGVLPILAVTLLFFGGLGGLARLAERRPALGQVLSVTLILLTAGYAVADPFFRRRPDLLVGSKNFLESRLLGEMLRLLLGAHTDLTVEHYPNLGSNFAYKSLQAGVLDVYPEYTGTLLTAKDALGVERLPVTAEVLDGYVGKGVLTPTEAASILKAQGEDRAAAANRLVRLGMRTAHGLELLEPFGLNNTYAVVVTPALAGRDNLKTIGDLKPSYRVALPQEFLERPDGWPGLAATYRLRFDRPPLQLDPNFLYKTLLAGDADAAVGFATDWQIGVHGLRVLDDDRNYFPAYHAAPLVRAEVLKQHPEVAPVLNRLAGRVGDDAMRRMLAEVVVGKRRTEDVARAFLVKEGLLGGGAAE